MKKRQIKISRKQKPVIIKIPKGISDYIWSLRLFALRGVKITDIKIGVKNEKP